MSVKLELGGIYVGSDGRLYRCAELLPNNLFSMISTDKDYFCFWCRDDGTPNVPGNPTITSRYAGELSGGNSEFDSSYKFRPAQSGTYTVTLYLKDGQDPFESLEQRGVIRGLRMAAEFCHSTCAWTAEKMCTKEAERMERELEEKKK